jgi:hypothetical protein
MGQPEVVDRACPSEHEGDDVVDHGRASPAVGDVESYRDLTHNARRAVELGDDRRADLHPSTATTVEPLPAFL